MNRRSLSKFLAGITAVALLGPATLLAQPAGFVPVEALRRGGYVILFRHTTTVRVQEPTPLDLADCANQHRLTEQGREEARAIGAALRALDIPVGSVLASPYCRTLETARLAFGRVQRLGILLHPAYAPLPGIPAPPSYQQRTDALKALLSKPPTDGTNTVLITHGENIRDAVGFGVEQGEALIYRGDGSGSSLLVARVLSAQWTATAIAYGAKR